MTIDVPAGTASVSLRLSFDFNGSDHAAFDNVVVEGIPAAGGRRIRWPAAKGAIAREARCCTGWE